MTKISINPEGMENALTSVLTEYTKQNDAWDLPPALFLTYLVTIDKDLGVGAIALLRVPFDDSMWLTEGSTENILSTLAEELEPSYVAEITKNVVDSVMSPDNSRFIGTAFLVEAWAVVTPDMPVDYKYGWATEHPDRVEIRTLYAVDIEGRGYIAAHKRGTPTEDILAASEDNPGKEMTGEVSVALREITSKWAAYTLLHRGDLNPDSDDTTNTDNNNGPDW